MKNYDDKLNSTAVQVVVQCWCHWCYCCNVCSMFRTHCVLIQGAALFLFFSWILTEVSQFLLFVFQKWSIKHRHQWLPLQNCRSHSCQHICTVDFFLYRFRALFGDFHTETTIFLPICPHTKILFFVFISHYMQCSTLNELKFINFIYSAWLFSVAFQLTAFGSIRVLLFDKKQSSIHITYTLFFV